MADNGNIKKMGKPAKKSFGKYVKELKAEFKRITWPKKSDVKKAVIAVFTFCVIAIAMVSLMDLGFGSLAKLIFK